MQLYCTLRPCYKMSLLPHGSTAAASVCPVLAQRGLREYDVIACINFIRAEVAAGRDPRPAVARAGRDAPVPWSGERYLKPVLPNDPLLAYDWEDEAGPAAGPSGGTPAAGCAPSGSRAAAHSLLLPCCPCLPLCCQALSRQLFCIYCCRPKQQATGTSGSLPNTSRREEGRAARPSARRALLRHLFVRACKVQAQRHCAALWQAGRSGGAVGGERGAAARAAGAVAAGRAR